MNQSVPAWSGRDQAVVSRLVTSAAGALSLIAIDWGTSSFRAFRLAADGGVLARRHAPRGILQVSQGAFSDVLIELVGDWLDDGERRLLLCGMVGSRQGWREAPYVDAPAGIEELARALMP